MGSFSGCLYMGYGVRGHEGGLWSLSMRWRERRERLKGLKGLKMEGLGLCGSNSLG